MTHYLPGISALIGPCDDDLSILRRDDPDWGLCRAAAAAVPHAIHAVGAAGEFEFVTGFQGGDGLHERCAVGGTVLNDTLWRDRYPRWIITGGTCEVEQPESGKELPGGTHRMGSDTVHRTLPRLSQPGASRS